MIHAYCIRRAAEPSPAPTLRGVEGAPIRSLSRSGLALWVSDLAALPPTPERLRAHDRVVRAALATATPLPIRYGAGAFRGDAAALGALEERAADFRESLDRVAGRIEAGLRVEWVHPPSSEAGPTAAETAPAGGSGRAYLEVRRRKLQAAETLRTHAAETLDRVESALALDDVPSRRTLLPAAGVAGTLAHLVQRGAVSQYRERVETARAALPDLVLSLSGPWAPYSFV